jgi:hypothetical protein
MDQIDKISKKSRLEFETSYVFAAVLLVILVLLAGWLCLGLVVARGKDKRHNYSEKFGGRYQVEETDKMSDSQNKDWWVNSGGEMVVSGGTAKTVFGDLSSSDKWKKEYELSNPKDTDNGLHPQNIFRLVGRKRFKDFSQEVFFSIKKINLSESPNRNESNGFLLLSRYEDEDNLYYAGLRVDGWAVIKKKVGGKYYTLDESRIFKGDEYDRDANPNLLPLNQWMGVRTVVMNRKDGNAEISLFWKEKRNSQKWELIAHCVDNGKRGEKIENAGYGGIRTDFMDVEFNDYEIKGL